MSQQTKKSDPVSPFNNHCLQGKTAVITGGASGICYQITRQLLAHGCSTATILGRRESFLQASAKSLQEEARSNGNTTASVYYQVCDVRSAEACTKALAFASSKSPPHANGSIDIVINGAAGNFLAEAGTSLQPKGFKTVLEIDTIGTYNLCHAAYPYLRKATLGSACVINISATLQYGATWYQTHASAAKAAVDSITRSLGLEWGKYGIRVNGIAPGPIADTPGTTKLAPGVDGEDVAEMVSEGVPLGRMGLGFDIGMAAVFLTGSGGSYITGETLVVDGGEWLFKPPMVPREMVAELSRSVEKKSRDMRPQSKL